ncbi:LuxR C-terminal-related transcriptional regulator [Variovorax sp. J22R115]|uniref:LuxR C-terminal-related transcriptional regulator n=1 Tax=Variovorax sp. J22R115 TaxID=3053509 RepID=UPI002574D9D5|nr:LuxR C-terminal-related transcriptional regulator [Variovorax sp. J22R115]MDM0048856.1 LuxR C-terminal-related transcriptional regulator [Variovorax sp. J22R115]
MSSLGPRPLSLKLCAPRPALREIERSAIAAVLAQTTANVVLISAPAGYGKSTAMAQWLRALRAQDIPVAWLTVDVEDNDPGRFVFHLQSALARVLAESSQTQELAQRVEPETTAGSHAYQLLEALAQIESGFALFVDDLEHIDSAEVLATLGRVIDTLGSNQRIVLGSRTKPPLPLGRLRARGMLLEVDQNALRFSVDETRDYLDSRLPSALDEADLARLQQRTDGWPAALQLATALSGSSGIDAVLRNKGDFSRDMATYLVEDVLARLPARQLEFLLQTALFESLCAAMCDAVLERDDSAALLQKTERDNLFLLAMEADGEWYRYHPLFLAFLRSQPGFPTRDTAAQLHVKAARWLAAEGRLMLAIHHAVAGGQQDLAAEWMALRAAEMVNTGQMDTLRRWIDATPDQLLETHPELAISGAYAMAIQRRRPAASRLIDIVGRIAEPGSQVAHELVGAKLAVFMWGDDLPQAAALALACMDGFDTAPPRMLGLIHNVAAFDCISRGDYAQALRYLATAKRIYVGEIHGVNHTMCLEGAIDLHQGNVHEARLRFEATLDKVIEAGYRFTDASGVAAGHLAEALYEMNDLQAVELLLEEYLPVIRDACVPDHVIAAYRFAARTHALRGRTELVQQTLAEMLDLGDAWGIPRIASAARQEKLRLALLAGDLAGARHLMTLIEHSGGWKSEPGQFPYAEDLDDAFIASVRLSMRSGAAPSMIPRIQEAVAQAEAVNHTRRAVRLRCLLAQAYEAALKRPQALEVLEQALDIASTKGLVRVLADEPWHLQPLLDAMATRDGVRPLHLAAVNDALHPSLAAKPSAPTHSAAEGLLSQRERQVLRLLADGLSNKELSRKLFISENTVESHLRRINGKLGAKNRTQAVTRAREWGLV